MNKNQMWWTLRDVDAGKDGNVLGMEWFTIDPAQSGGVTFNAEITPNLGGGSSISGEIVPGKSKSGVQTVCGIGKASVGFKIVDCSQYSAYSTDLLSK